MGEKNKVQPGFVAAVFLGLITTTAGAQAVNDSCLSATGLGLLEFTQVCLFDPGNGQPGATPFADSTVLAGPEFPYPAMAVPCDGYSGTVTVPSNDVWYSFQPMCSFAIEVVPGPFYTTDTVHISVWHGPDCGQLVPLKCYTLPANTALSDSSLPFYPGTYYLQISSPTLASLSRFSICLRGTQLPCAPSEYTYGEPTPVICFTYSLTTGHAPEAGANGSATLILDEAFGPYTVLWSDGTPDVLSRSDLPVGDHTVTVTSGNECTEVINIAILLDPALGMGHGMRPERTNVHMVHGLLVVTGAPDRKPVGVDVFDARGAQVGTWYARSDGAFPVCSLGVGIHVACLHFADERTLRIPFAVLP